MKMEIDVISQLYVSRGISIGVNWFSTQKHVAITPDQWQNSIFKSYSE